jgi:predicted NAD/FAD-binding protein
MAMNHDPFKLSLGNFLSARGSNDPLQAPASFTSWVREQAWARPLYEPELLAAAEARTTITYNGKAHSVINLCSYNYLGLANHPEVIAAAQEALTTSTENWSAGSRSSSVVKMRCCLTADLAAHSEQFPACFERPTLLYSIIDRT